MYETQPLIFYSARRQANLIDPKSSLRTTKASSRVNNKQTKVKPVPLSVPVQHQTPFRSRQIPAKLSHQYDTTASSCNCHVLHFCCLRSPAPCFLTQTQPVAPCNTYLYEGHRDVPQVLKFIHVQLGAIVLSPHAQQLRNAALHKLTERLPGFSPSQVNRRYKNKGVHERYERTFYPKIWKERRNRRHMERASARSPRGPLVARGRMQQRNAKD